MRIHIRGYGLWENFFAELLKLSPQLLVTFLGVFLAFSLDRAIDSYNRRQNRKDLLRDLRDELEEIKRKLRGKGNLHFPDIWKSAISSGQIRLLNSEQVTKLARVYRNIQGAEYEARRFRDIAEKYRAGGRSDKERLEEPLVKFSVVHKRRERKLRGKIEELLKENWWS